MYTYTQCLSVPDNGKMLYTSRKHYTSSRKPQNPLKSVMEHFEATNYV